MAVCEIYLTHFIFEPGQTKILFLGPEDPGDPF